jgi:2-octaprenyl-6-methoxyphenol hydroxylase
MTEGRCALVWTFPEAEAEGAAGWPEPLFLERLQARFGRRLGAFRRAGARRTYPLSRVTVDPAVGPRFAVIGNAAHTLHPVAGQGFNLGLRDVAVLAEAVCDAAAAGGDPGAPGVLDHYARRQHRDQARVGLFTDTLVRVFSNRFPPLVVARNLGLVALDLAPPAKHLFARQAMGLAGWQPRLARGLPL